MEPTSSVSEYFILCKGKVLAVRFPENLFLYVDTKNYLDRLEKKPVLLAEGMDFTFNDPVEDMLTDIAHFTNMNMDYKVENFHV